MNLRELFPELQEGSSLEAPFGQWQPGMFSASSQPKVLQTPNYAAATVHYNSSSRAPTESMTNTVHDPFMLPNDLDFLLIGDDTTMYDGNPGIDLGFECGENRWAEGPQVDLFDGFFFGGTNA